MCNKLLEENALLSVFDPKVTRYPYPSYLNPSPNPSPNPNPTLAQP